MNIKVCSNIKIAKISCYKLNKYLSQINRKNYKCVLLRIRVFPQKIKNLIWKFLNSLLFRINSTYILENNLLFINKCYAINAGISKKLFIHAKGKASKHEKRDSYIYTELLLNIPTKKNISV